MRDPDLRATGPTQPPPLLLSSRRARSFWPDLRHEALLDAALSEPPRLEPALARWRRHEPLARVDYPTLTLLPLLFRNLGRHGLAAELRTELAGVYRWSWHRNQLLLADLRGALAALRAAGVEVAITKGLPLAHEVYGDLGARVMGDADLVVRRPQAAPAERALAAAGWTVERPLAAAEAAGLGAAVCRNARGRALDLHIHPFADCFDARVGGSLLDRCRPIELGGERVLAPEPTDHLVLVLGHGLSWAANAPLHWVADAVLLLRRHAGALDAGRIVELAAALGRTRCVHRALEYLERRFAAPLPSGLLAELARRPTGIGERTAFWFAERSGVYWPWGRAPVVAALFLRSSRARGRRPGLLGFLRFVSARAGCTPRQWLRRATVEFWRQLRRSLEGIGSAIQGGTGT